MNWNVSSLNVLRDIITNYFGKLSNSKEVYLIIDIAKCVFILWKKINITRIYLFIGEFWGDFSLGIEKYNYMTKR